MQTRNIKVGTKFKHMKKNGSVHQMMDSYLRQIV